MQDKAGRGYCVLSKRTWERIRIEFSGGASVAWLSARYGAAERTIASHAKTGGWRRKDLALKAEEAWDAGDEAAARAAEVAAAREGAGAGERAAGAPEGGDPPVVDLIAAARQARASAVAVMEKHPRLAQDYLKLAGMLEGADADGETGDRPSPQDEAALAFVLDKLGYEG